LFDAPDVIRQARFDRWRHAERCSARAKLYFIRCAIVATAPDHAEYPKYRARRPWFFVSSCPVLVSRTLTEPGWAHVFFTTTWLKDSLNYHSLLVGLAFPTYYTGLFPHLRRNSRMP
jgi:hypothetical protein